MGAWKKIVYEEELSTPVHWSPILDASGFVLSLNSLSISNTTTPVTPNTPAS